MIREFNYKLIEVFHLKIGKKVLKLWNLEVTFWVPFLKPIGTDFFLCAHVLKYETVYKDFIL